MRRIPLCHSSAIDAEHRCVACGRNRPCLLVLLSRFLRSNYSLRTALLHVSERRGSCPSFPASFAHRLRSSLMGTTRPSGN